MKRIGIGPISNDNPNYTYLLTITQKNYLCQFFMSPSLHVHYSEIEIF